MVEESEIPVVKTVLSVLAGKVFHVLRVDMQEEPRGRVSSGASVAEVEQLAPVDANVEAPPETGSARRGRHAGQTARIRQGRRILARRERLRRRVCAADAADARVSSEPFQQRLRRPAVVAGGARPSGARVEPRLAGAAARVGEVVELIDDGNPALRRHGRQRLERPVVPKPHLVSRQNNEGGAVAVRALLELVERKGGEAEHVFPDARRMAPQKPRAAGRAGILATEPPLPRPGDSVEYPGVVRPPVQAGYPFLLPPIEVAGGQRRGGSAQEARPYAVQGKRRGLHDQVTDARGDRRRRAQGHGPVLGPDRRNLRQQVRVHPRLPPIPPERARQRRIQTESARAENQHQKIGLQGPCIDVVIGQLTDLPGSRHAPGRGRNVEPGQIPGGQFLQTDMEFVGNRNPARLHEAAAERGDVAACDGAAAVHGRAVEKAQAVDPLDDAAARTDLAPRLGARFVEGAHAGNEDCRRPQLRESGSIRQPEPDIRRYGRRQQAREQKGEEKNRLPHDELRVGRHPPRPGS